MCKVEADRLSLSVYFLCEKSQWGVTIKTNRAETKGVHEMLNVYMCMCAGCSDAVAARKHNRVTAKAACPSLSAATIIVSM